MSKYFEIVDISQKPDKEGWYIVSVGGTHCEALFGNDEWSGVRVGMPEPDAWLRPLDRLPISREQADPSVLIEALEEIKNLTVLGKRYSVAYDNARERANMALIKYKQSQPVEFKSISKEQASKVWDDAVFHTSAVLLKGAGGKNDKEEYLKQFDKQ